MKPYVQPIFTLNARGNVMLEVMHDYFKLTTAAMHREIQGLHLATQEILQSKGIAYAQLKSGLVPIPDRNEAAFIFDSQCIDSSWYGLEIAKVTIPIFDNLWGQSRLIRSISCLIPFSR